MPILKFINKSYTTEKTLKKVIHYAIRKDKCQAQVYGGQGVPLTGLKDMYNSMMTIKNNFDKCDGRMLMHLVLSFSEEEEKFIDERTALSIGYEVSAHFFENYQVVFGVHDNTDNLHIHFVVNTVNYYNGLKYNIGPYGLIFFNQEVDDIVRRCINNSDIVSAGRLLI